MAILSSFSAQTMHRPDSVFSLWADPATWPAWDSEIREVSFAGPAKLGARGRIRPVSGPATSFSVTAFEVDRVFTNVSSMPAARLTFEHVVAPSESGSDVTVTVYLDGLLAPLWKCVVGGSLADAARSSVTGLLSYLDAA